MYWTLCIKIGVEEAMRGKDIEILWLKLFPAPTYSQYNEMGPVENYLSKYAVHEY